MKRTLREALLGGPGLDGYAYCADTYCEDCGKDIIRKLYNTEGYAPSDDVDDEPQPIFFGEADQAVHCADCGEYMYGEEEEGAPTCLDCGERLTDLDGYKDASGMIDYETCLACRKEAEEARPPYLREAVPASDIAPPYLREGF